MECTRLVDGRPAGDLLPWKEVRFPYDPSLRDADLMAEDGFERTGTLAGEEIEERYTYGRDGRISVQIRNLARGYAREFELTGQRAGQRVSGSSGT